MKENSLSIVRLMLIMLLICISELVFAQLLPPPYTYQSSVASELILKKRPDISDSTYQVFQRFIAPCWKCNGISYVFNNSVRLALYDTCSQQNQTIEILLTQPNNRLIINPFSLDSNDKRIFKVCGNGSPNFIGLNGNNPNYIFPGYIDTFEVLKDYWFSDIIDLPNKCGMWQIGWSSGGNLTCTSIQASPYDNNLSTNLDTTDYYNYGIIQGFPYKNYGITQMNSIMANSSPYFLSYPVAHYPKNTLIHYQQNAVDPDGDSLVWSSIHMVYFDTVHGVQPNNYWAPFVPQKECANAPLYNFFSPISSGFRKSPGYACIPGTGTLPSCIKYDPVYNPFDTDSTYYLNPQTGEVTFVAKSAPQSVNLLLRCDEYRQGVWVGSVNRRVDFFITDSMYYEEPTIYIDSTNLVNCALDTPFVFYACKNQNLSIPFVVKAVTNASYLGVSDNHAVGLPAATITYQNNHTDSVRGTLQWYAGNADTGWHYVQVRVYDSACSVTPYMNEFTYLLKIYITSGLQLATNDTTICAGSSVQLNAVGLGNQVTWSVLNGTPNSLSCTPCAHPLATPATTTRYVVSGASLGLSCVSNDTVTVSVVQDFTLHATDTVVCSKSDLILKANATGNNMQLQYQWSPANGIIGGSNNSFVLIAPATINYIVTVSDNMGCFTHTDTSTVIYDSTFNPIYTIDKQSICTGDTVNITVVGGNGTVAWSPNYHISALQGINVQAWPDTSVNYMATVSSLVSTCKKDISIPIKVTALRADAGPDQEIFDGESVVLGGPSMLVGADCKVQWFPDEWLFFNFYKNPKAVPHVSTTYWVMISDETGSCIDRDSVTIRVKCTDIYIPNAFNPESLGNEYTKTFGPRNVSIDLDYFRIYNRWGELVFQTRDVGYRWDGNFNGKPQPVGTYVWMIRGKCPNGEPIEKKGNVTLIR